MFHRPNFFEFLLVCLNETNNITNEYTAMRNVEFFNFNFASLNKKLRKLTVQNIKSTTGET